MLQNIGIGRFHNQFAAHTPAASDRILFYRQDSVLAVSGDGVFSLPRFDALPDCLQSCSLRYAFSIDTDCYFVADICQVDPEQFPEGWRLIPSREYRNSVPREFAFACSVGESLHRWIQNNRFCGHCGSPMEDSTSERAFVCPGCGLTVYPKICPAVIVAVCDGDRLLLTKYRGRAFSRYALVAGFNEIGETIEDTVHREVLEETGLRVKNLRFYKSQPWVLTDSLLMGFFCELEGDDHVTLQEDELSVATWFTRDALPDDHSGISLTGEMIEVFRAGRDPYGASGPD